VKLFAALGRPFPQIVGLLSIILTPDRGFENMGGSVCKVNHTLYLKVCNLTPPGATPTTVDAF